jgi:hypothetical protein
MRKMCSWRFLVPVVAVIFLGCTTKPEMIERKCSNCHKTSVVYAKKRPMAEWKGLINGMKVRGLKVTPDEEQAIMEALSKYYSK